jgi:HK97 family phage major capsid protein
MADIKDESPEAKQKRAAEEAAASTKAPESIAAVDMARNDEELTFRYFRASKEDFSDDNTFQVRMSSEYPAEQRATAEHERLGIAKKGEKYVEVLSHEEGDVDLSRFTGDNRAALLDEHNDKRHLGFIKTAALSKDKSTRGVVTFDNVAKLSVTRCAQVRSGSRPNFSIGYSQTRYLGKTTLADGRTAHRFAWRGLELSNVAVPADPTAQKGRSKNSECHCIGCGDIYGRSELDENFMCTDCVDAETPAEGGDERKVLHDAREFRAKKDGKEIRISHNDLRDKANMALNNDKRFKAKRENGDTVSDFYTHDIHLVSDSADEYQAIVSSPAWSRDRKTYAVDFQYDGSNLTLGEHTEVVPKTTFEAVDRGLPFDAKTFRAVDSPNFADADKTARSAQTESNKNFMAKNLAELKTEAPELVSEIETATRTATEKTTRAAVRTEITNEIKGEGKRAALVKEIRSLANEFIKDKGPNFYGKPGEVTTVGERIRSFEQESLMTALTDEGRSDSEIRSDFKNRVNDVIHESRAPKNPTEAAKLDQSLASRCSLGRVLREGIRAADKLSGRSNCFMIQDGAEAEADKEIRKNADEFPGGADSLPAGIQLPWNMPSGVRGNTAIPRMGRDALAADFGTAGALIAPDYQFPTIELLRNLPALARAGMTVLSGLLGSPIVLPRQTSPTVAQSLAEGGALVQYDQTLDQIKLSAHRVGTSQKYSRLALLQSTPDFEAMVMADHMAALALQIDYLGLNGQGAGDQPLGVLNQLIQSIVFAGSASNAYANAVSMETLIRAANVPDDISYITTSTGRGQLKSVAKVLKGATTVVVDPIWTDGGLVNGRPAWDSQQVPNNVILAGAFRHLVMAQWGGLAVVLDTISQANQDKYWLNINTYVDFALRHNQAFCRSADSIALLS